MAGGASDREEDQPAGIHEDVEPAEGAAWRIEPAVRWHPNRIRAWIAVSSIALIALMLIGLFVLILLDVTGERLLVWQAALGTVMTLAAAVTAYYFSRSGGAA